MWQKIVDKIKQKSRFFIGMSFVALGVCVDRCTKILALNHIKNLIAVSGNPSATHKIFPGFNLVLVFNRGVAFGVFNGDFFAKFMPVLLLFVTTVIVCGIVYYFWNSNDNTISYTLLIAGGFGNIVDRLTFGAVVDFIDIYVGEYHWPAFNLADALVCCGIILCVLRD
jgi:signal peptidase II